MDFFGEEAPTACGAAGGAPAGSIGGGRFTAGVHHGTELVETVGGGEACGREFPESLLGLLLGEVEDALDIVGEAGAALLEESPELQGFGAESLLQLCFFDTLLREGVWEPVGGLADVEGYGGGVSGDHAARGGTVALGPGRMRRDAAPAYGSGEAESIEPAGIIIGDAGGEQGPLPFNCGRFEAFELMKSVEDTFLAGELRLRGEMLPLEQPAHVDAG